MLAAPNMGPEYAGRFNAIYPALAKDYGIPLYPFFLEGVIGNAHYMQADSIHPNPVGIDVVVSNIAPLVADTLSTAAYRTSGVDYAAHFEPRRTQTRIVGQHVLRTGTTTCSHEPSKHK